MVGRLVILASCKGKYAVINGICTRYIIYSFTQSLDGHFRSSWGEGKPLPRSVNLTEWERGLASLLCYISFLTFI